MIIAWRAASPKSWVPQPSHKMVNARC